MRSDRRGAVVVISVEDGGGFDVVSGGDSLSFSPLVFDVVSALTCTGGCLTGWCCDAETEVGDSETRGPAS